MSPNVADVIVVGAGGAGLSAALVAARLGRQVLVLEKNDQPGGTTARSVGSITATCTPHQKAAGIDDSPDLHFEDLALFAGPLANRDNLALRRLLVDNVPETMRFLMDLGIEFIGPMPEPPHRHPRMHNIVPHSRGYIHHLARHCRRAGVVIRTGARVRGLLDRSGRISGVELQAPGGSTACRARRAVILACGDYSSDATLKTEFVGERLAAVEGISPTSTGDGQRLAREVGAEILNGDVMLGPEIRFVAPPQPKLLARLPPGRVMGKTVKWAMAHLPNQMLRPFLMSFVTTNLAPSHNLFQQGAVLINRTGERFCDELDAPQHEIPAQPEGIAYVLLDAHIAGTFAAWPHFVSTAPGVAYAYLDDYRRHRRDICTSAASLEDLAAKLGLPGQALAATVNAYNANARGDRPPLIKPPFTALGPAKSWIVITDGGVRVTERMEVVGRGGAIVPGLFAAGSTGQGGLLLEGHGHHLGWAFTSGRIAGRSAAFAEPMPPDGPANPSGPAMPEAKPRTQKRPRADVPP